MKAKPKHRYLITETHGDYTWACSCGEYDSIPRTYERARAGVRRHRRMVAARGEGPAVRQKAMS